MKTATRTVTIKDVAREAGVALGTVSRILNGHENVDPALRKKVRKVISALGYERNATARLMRIGKTLAVGCIISDIRQPIAAEMVTGAESVLRDAGYAMIVASTHYDDAQEAEILAFMRERRVDGLLTIANRDSDPKTLRRLQAMALPIVLWERDVSGKFDAVVGEHRAGVAAAVEHLIGLGHRDILLIAGHPGTWVGREQAGGFEDAYRRAGAPSPRRRIFHIGEMGEAGLRKMLAAPSRPTAVIANINDIPAVLSICAEFATLPPRDMSIVSIGDSEFLTLTAPQITSIRGQPKEIGRHAARRLLSLLSDKKPAEPQRRAFPMDLIVRSSTAAPPRRS